MKILLTGGTSKLGIRVQDFAERSGFDITSINLIPPYRSMRLDIRDKDKVGEFVAKLEPDYIVHLAALSSADVCETDRDNCHRTNVFAIRNLAEACSLIGGRMISISSDYVFNGDCGPYSEIDQTSPINEYGRAKLEGERILSRYCPNSVSIRSCVLYDWETRSRRENFLVWLIRKLEKNEQVTIVNDQYSTPTFIPQLAEVILDLLKNEYRGVIHVSGSEYISRYDFSLEASKIFGLDKSLIKENDSTGFIQSALRPLKGGLKVERVEKLLEKEMLSCSKGLELCRQIKDGSIESFNG